MEKKTQKEDEKNPRKKERVKRVNPKEETTEVLDLQEEGKVQAQVLLVEADQGQLEVK